jgi:pyruvate/2-oxoglutarate dehydrogenase complex dihydrolipoamide acyltransferase (E2) component
MAGRVSDDMVPVESAIARIEIEGEAVSEVKPAPAAAKPAAAVAVPAAPA